MKSPFHSSARRDTGAVLAGLMEVLRSRGAEVQWHEEGCRDHIMALVGGDGGLEVHAFVGTEPVPRLGPIIIFQAIHPLEPDRKRVGRIAVFCDRSNEAMYGAKLYMRQAPGDPDIVQLVVERGTLVGNGDLYRIADEFELLVAEYFMADEKLDEEFPMPDAVSQASMLGLLDEPLVENC